MKNKKLKGFTILEALISLMLMSIIITVTYALFNLTERQLSGFKKENFEVLEYNLFNSTLLMDIETSTDFSCSDNELLLENYNTNTIYYSIHKQHILRQNQTKVDTFNIEVIDFGVLESNEKHNTNTTLQLALNILNDTINANYFLKKDNSELINTRFFSED
ncbi:prepilin-type N-terminal cleavage/methylation domain-containing protein [Hyunsoonleella pacifica]|uniref:Prepilin-type N-terminal cleavage/methylation domain-containing protein n=1 Tax=Hyunsoonleella pacifica TaxID=1080224 RepID=A0A4Q9FJT7_9FLAO|nr:prepilin-type N-terminal cleavage/methylation domain-containing protein [Hyunsoonleella pacifica]TBN11967.1 hypothetical protein EYD46_17520 [Hyunsoonleella pacifica]GGD07670.1 hypothetical protein GCM10011368_07020 [Hyunsoonleella pacifica]